MICPLCKKECYSFKKNSHVIPRSFYKKIKNQGKSMLFSGGKWSLSQKDLKGDFICEKCENFIARKIEDPAIKLLNILYTKEKTNLNSKFLEINTKNEENILIWKLVISILVRYGFYHLKYNKKDLFNKHLDLMRKELLNENPNIDKYPLLLIKSDINIDYEPLNIILEPNKKKFFKYHWELAFLDLILYVRIASHRPDKNIYYLKNNKLILILDNELLLNLLNKTINK